MIFARNAQEAGDFCLISRRVAEATQTPFFNIQDGFLTTHTVETVRLPEPEFMKEFIGDPKEKLMNLMDPDNPIMSGVVQNQDSYMKGKIAQRWYYDQVAPALEEAFEEFARKTGRQLRDRRAVPVRRCGVRPRRHGLLHGDRQGHDRLPARQEGDQGRVPDGVRVPPVPGDGHRRRPQGLRGVHRVRAHGRSALDHRQPPDARDQGRVLRRGRGQNGQEKIDRSPAGSITRPPAWAAATCGRATSSPRSTT